MLGASLPWDLEQYSVCDNVDLKIILEEYSSFHQVKYSKKPDICRRADKENSEVAVKRKKAVKLNKRSPSEQLAGRKAAPLAEAGNGMKDLQITGRGKSAMEDDIKASHFDSFVLFS